MTNGMYYSILACICWTRFAPKYLAFGSWVVFLALATGSKMGWL